MFATRRFASLAPRAFGAARGFQSTARACVEIGDAIPNVDLLETSPGNKVNIAKELQGKGVIVGVPAAFSTLPNLPMVHRRLPSVPAADE
jgi:2-Cys peroxiredoxin 5